MAGLLISNGKRRFSYTLALALVFFLTVLFAPQAKAGIDFTDGFESGTYTPTWTDGAGAYTREVTSSTAAVGTYSFTQTGVSSHKQGISTTLPDLTPTDISFYVRTNYLTTTGEATAYFLIGDDDMNLGSIFFYLGEGEIQVYDGSTFYSAGAYTVNTWYHIEFKNINWINETFDYYVDDVLIASSIPFRDSATSFTQIHLYNYTNSQAWYDEIVLAHNDAAYIRGASAPWGSSSNETAMDTAFPEGWDDLRMADGAHPFSPDSGYEIIYLEGSDNTALELDSFLTANRTDIETWVSDGGRLLLNAAPNEPSGGGDINFGFSGVTLIYSDGPSDVHNATVPNSAHPIINGPNVPITDTFSGSAFSHAYLTGGNLKPIIVGAPGDPNEGVVVLGEKSYGSGRVLMGGMTTDNWHNPQPDAANLRANILRYLRSDTIINPGFEIGDLSGWTAVTTGGNLLEVMSGVTPPSGVTNFPAPPEGTYAAVRDTTGPGNSFLYQDFIVPSGSYLKATIYVKNLAMDYVDGPGFDSGVSPNQKVRLDLMDPAAPIDDVGSGVLENLFITLPGDASSISPTTIRVNLLSYAGQTIRLRLGAVDNQEVLIVGLDDIQVRAIAPSGGGGGGGGCFISTITR